jgi:electron transfer flavoprotein beta subunit
MNVFVLVKQVPDTETKAVPNAQSNYIDLANVNWIMNPYDEHAVEQAVKEKEKNPSINIIALRVGSVQKNEVLRTAMAMGADESILVEGNDDLDPFTTAKALKLAIEKSGKKADLIFAGKVTIDGNNSQVPQILAGMMNLPAVSSILSFEMNGEKTTVKREIEGSSFEVYETTGPAVYSCHKGLNEPRYASLPGIMKAKKKPLVTFSLKDLGIVANETGYKIEKIMMPADKPPGKIFQAMEEKDRKGVVEKVVGLLKTEAKVL